MKTFIKDFLTYSRSEKRGVVALLVIFIVLFAVRLYSPAVVTDDHPADFSGYDKETTEFMTALRRAGDSLDSLKKVKISSYTKEYPENGNSFSWAREKVSPSDTMVIDLNGCDTLDLQVLRGIGPYFARNIVNYRELLGGFVSKSQLLEVYGMDSARYSGIIDRISISKGDIKKLDLNKDPFKTFLRHPYFEFYLVKEIFRYRSKYGFDSVTQVQELEVMNERLYRKIKPYIKVVKGE
jgi:DNA uptake protein ComE-like DNA-binding protein